MLQQTTVVAVIPYFLAFTVRWPTVDALAAADDADVMAAWAGLGYYARARNLLKCARLVAARGGFPDSEAELLKLPGIGAYTAAAIAAIAFGKRAVVVDGNIERVVARLFEIQTPLPAAKPALRAAMDRITPDARCGDFAQAMMDLGATLCTPRAPKCLLCPIQAQCRANDPAALPRKAPKKARPHRYGTLWWIERDGVVALIRRPATGLLGGMRALPGSAWTTTPLNMIGPSIDHGFTHFDLTLFIEQGQTRAHTLPPDVEWWPIDQIENAGLPTVFAKAARLMTPPKYPMPNNQ
jgi:A/G-specific adenine glycosylase